ncbi:hypothetical protein MKY85_08155 [Paenibacillus sp. FSL R5-0749]
MKSVPFSILLASAILGICFIIGCIILTTHERNSELTQAVEQVVPNDKVLLTMQ